MNKFLLAWTIIFIIIGGGILLYGMSFNPMSWANGLVTFIEPNDEPIPWGLLVIGYMFFGVIGTGVSTYNSLYELFNKNHPEKNPFKNISLRNEWIALTVLIPGWIMVFASTYKPGEAVYIYTSFRDTSRIAWNGLLYALVGIGIILEILALIGEKRREYKDPISRLLAWLSSKSVLILIVGYAILMELILDANLGSVFGYLSTWVYEFGPFMSMLFVILSFYSGIAMLSFMTPLYNRFRKVKEDPNSLSIHEMYKILGRDGVLATIAVGFSLLWWLWLTATNQQTSAWAELMISGPYSVVFLIGGVLVGVIIPIILYGLVYKRGSSHMLVTSSIFTLLGMFSIITIADIIPQSITWYYSVSPISPSNSNWVYELRSIFNNGPSWTHLPFNISFYDIVFFIGSVLLLLGIYTLGVILLPLEEDEKPRHLIFK
ncbi:formate-dependent nitrite reductase, membrane component [Metallosphaera yellowstonensis MK1]|uniref:Formate-dependent nitrite reductase, membrane component n=1 Tax=Metallosphaera yellowstonensis MK1 TaxID=671065 RepID=H2C1R9_9CREN|nr:NrfD/PsrC family molybdoenzyme membrane anchor subunit [Metallosphaera yellowstonensis]EHP70190.1 formate-dependent nitrite reductase, membrane component [Metallosphaera yellowstonensis MK1]